MRSEEADKTVEERLREMGLELPEAPPAAANYRPFVLAGPFLFVSGQLPLSRGQLLYRGHVGVDLTVDEGYAAARICALNVLSQVKAALLDFERLESLVRVDGHVACAPGFTSHPQVLNGASDLFRKALAERSGHARVALGHNELPLGAAVEIAATFHVRVL
jgi:enamine deaminase RidA (YjgF/YER057c/UK114 family)